jgi:hypothetical protein
VVVVEPVDDLHTAFQAQCVRLLQPALVETDGAVLTADIDMLPLDPRYFHRHAGRVDERHFLAYRDVLLWGGEIPICYNAARPRTWRTIFGVETLSDVRERLEVWTRGLEYTGARGGAGWFTDQQILYQTLLDRGPRDDRVWLLDDRFTGHRRLERGALAKRGELDGTPDVTAFAAALEAASLAVIDRGVMTKDLVPLTTLEVKEPATTEGFIDAVAEELDKTLAARP